jgi:hypothetical protein
MFGPSVPHAKAQEPSISRKTINSVPTKRAAVILFRRQNSHPPHIAERLAGHVSVIVAIFGRPFASQHRGQSRASWHLRAPAQPAA